MTDDTTNLTRLRTRMLATAFSNAGIWTRNNAFLTDQAVTVLARRDPAAAEALATSLLAPEFLNDTQILDAATEAGIDTSTWQERRDKTRLYARQANELSSTSDPATEAGRIWASLYEHHPQIAAALADFLQQMPGTWREDLFTPSPHSPATLPHPRQLPAPETAPYDELDWEDCPACAEAQAQCRYHAGFFAGMDYQRDLITTAMTDHTAVDQIQQRRHTRTPDARRPHGRWRQRTPPSRDTWGGRRPPIPATLQCGPTSPKGPSPCPNPPLPGEG